MVVDDVSSGDGRSIWVSGWTSDDPIMAIKRWLGAGRRVVPLGAGRCPSVLRLRGTHMNLDGNSMPAQRWSLALGESFPGLPWNLAS